ncbi:hypothetical protein DDE83_005217 [Stemphylium lycopersici]|uniref:Uncharacterized protein n=1 Tax=Stemphylium lycopersici TaxID=183478 RepID=A0A364N351_STELY|nr:hypothetical protein DDE83_005217 [Stemphylium lycopersici]
MRPEALEAATSQVPQGEMQPAPTGSSGTNRVFPYDGSNTNQPSSLPSQSRLESTTFMADNITDDSSRATTLISEVIHGARAAVDDALAWAEKTVEALGSNQDGVGPYDSPGTCMPSDLDPIASGILPAMPNKTQHDDGIKKEAKNKDGLKEDKESHTCKDMDTKK